MGRGARAFHVWDKSSVGRADNVSDIQSLFVQVENGEARCLENEFDLDREFFPVLQNGEGRIAVYHGYNPLPDWHTKIGPTPYRAGVRSTM
jgi:hypothetical protein